MNIQIPLSLAEMLGSVVGLGVLAFFIGQWAKNALGDWRWTNWVTLGVVTATALVGTFILNSGKPTAEQVMWEAILAMMAVSIETFGYEGISNVLGMLGKGDRSDKALKDEAILTVLGPPTECCN